MSTLFLAGGDLLTAKGFNTCWWGSNMEGLELEPPLLSCCESRRISVFRWVYPLKKLCVRGEKKKFIKALP